MFLISRSIISKSVAIVAISTLLFGCNKNENSNPVTSTIPTGNYASSGTLVLHEGSFSGSGSVSYIMNGKSTANNDIYAVANNNQPLGTFAQDLQLINDKAYITVQNANKVEVVTANTFKKVASINNLLMPHSILSVSATKLYVTEWVNGYSTGRVCIVNPVTNTIKGYIFMDRSGPSQMAQSGDYVYVVNAGGFGKDSTVTVINTTTDQVIKSIEVGYNPNSVGIDANGKIWVLCGGVSYPLDQATSGAIVKINPITNTVESNQSFNTTAIHPAKLTFNNSKNTMYYLENGYGGNILQHTINANAPSTTPVITGNYYGLGINNTTLYAADAGDFASNGKVMTYQLGSNQLLSTYNVGIIPTAFRFK